jgi:hypothetical protein
VQLTDAAGVSRSRGLVNRDQAVNPVAVLNKTVVGEFMQHPLEQQGSGSDAYHQAKSVDEEMLVLGFKSCIIHCSDCLIA